MKGAACQIGALVDYGLFYHSTVGKKLSTVNLTRIEVVKPSSETTAGSVSLGVPNAHPAELVTP